MGAHGRRSYKKIGAILAVGTPAVDAWIAKQAAPMTRPEAIRATLDAVLVIVGKEPAETPAKKAKIR
jgi:hypothetical protein